MENVTWLLTVLSGLISGLRIIVSILSILISYATVKIYDKFRLCWFDLNTSGQAPGTAINWAINSSSNLTR